MEVHPGVFVSNVATDCHRTPAGRRRRVAAMNPPKDTSPDALAQLLDTLRRMGPQRRLWLAAEMSDELREIAKAGIRSRHPEYGEQQVTDGLEDLLLGEELASTARRTRLAPSR
jgi:hypothetical protein